MCPLPNWQPSNGFLRRRTERAKTGAMRLVSASALLATALLGSAHAEGDALVDLLGPREIAVGEAMRGGATGASAIGMNPAGISLNRELVFEGGYGYRAADGASGYFQHRFRVYDREGQPCPTPGCRGVIAREVQAGRSTFFCPVCQV